ncbi:PVC-type heme-binding CxxCH protein [Blastopirellula marina]|uniref:Dehydrogenase n=1 Tax=Blastopirellula marina TaxID=124 RepID=A0A2S8GEZ9_9BACT|nr:PVC-type heme-binding CxxCH protein [Blastopirellula marina]PQO43038.1 dehydrogenase [Blastopirellula marina]
MIRRTTFALLLSACFVSLAVAADPVGVLPKDAGGRSLNLDFETGTLADWTAEGEAFAGPPVDGDVVSKRRGDMKSRHQGKYWIGGYERRQDPPTGTLTSVPFQVTHPWAAFLHNGGPHEQTRVELVNTEDGQVFFKTSGDEREDMRRVVVDLRKLQGKEILIRLVDQHSGHWGHLNFDDFRFYDEAPAIPKDQPKRLVADMYPYGGLTAEEAAAAMQLPDGFSAIVSAAEPDIQQPIAMALDERGRLWVAEAYVYPQRAPEGKGKDRILIFADNDGDGKFDERKVFCEGLNLVSGLEVGFGGVWVGAAPYLMFIPDKNGDDVADGEPQVLLDGWGYQDTHETLNAFIWGPDGWLYGCHGVFTHSNVGKPGTPDNERTRINAGIWRYHPTRHTFEVFAHGTSNPWGVDFNDFGQAFETACVIPHLYQMIQGGRYQRQAGAHFNPHTYDDIKTIADHRHYLGGTPHGGNGKSDEAGGGHAHAGAMIYLGDRWPQAYRGQLFMNNIHGQRLNVDILKQTGSGYVGSHGPDFLLTGDKASQILNIRYLPDGNAYMIDWYDMQACHSGDPARHDRSNGRVYKIVYGEQENVQVDLRKQSDLELAELAFHKNDWYVRHARKVLQERAAAGKLSDDAVARLQEIAKSNADATRRLRAYWALHVTGKLDAATVNQMLADAEPFVRGWALQLALEVDHQPSPALLAQMVQLAADDPSPIVRLYLASAAQRMPLQMRWDLLSNLLSHAEDAQDHNLPLMYWYAAEPLAEVSPERALALGLAASQSIPQVGQFMLRRIGSGDAKSALATLVAGLKNIDDAPTQLMFLRSIRKALAGQRTVVAPDAWGQASHNLLFSDNADVRNEAMALDATFGGEVSQRNLLLLVKDEQAKMDARQFAIEALLSLDDPRLPATLQTLLSDPQLCDLALKGLAQHENAATPVAILNHYAKMTPGAKRLALATLSSRPGYAKALLTAIGEGKISSSELSADMVRQLSNLGDKEIDAKLADVWGTVRATPEEKAKLIEQYKALVANKSLPPADPQWGRAIFAKTCQRCHTLYGVGGNVGPDLTGSNRANLDYLLTNIVDPSAVMAKEYQPSIVLLESGRVITGIVKAEDDKTLSLQTAEETLLISQDEIDQRKVSDKSMMPDDQLRPFSEHDVRSLVAYLQGKSQTPQLATPETAVEFFNGRDLTGWNGDPNLWSVENGEIVGKTATGIKANAFLISDLAARDFRLTLEIRLAKNEGNSGVQFRSAALPGGSVKGYQADVGAGWWGKLYEEHGRGLLWDKSGEEHLKPDQWNQYEIVARGDHVQTFLNGKPCVDLHDAKGASQGIFALQLHSGRPTEVRFRNLKLELLESSE